MKHFAFQLAAVSSLFTALAFAATHGGATARTVEAVASLVLPTL